MTPPSLPQRLLIDLAVRVIAALAAAAYGGWLTWAFLQAMARAG